MVMKKKKGEEALPVSAGGVATAEGAEISSSSPMAATNGVKVEGPGFVMLHDEPENLGNEEGFQVVGSDIDHSTPLLVEEVVPFVKLDEEEKSIPASEVDEPSESMTEEEALMSFEEATAALLAQHPEGLTEEELGGRPLDLTSLANLEEFQRRLNSSDCAVASPANHHVPVGGIDAEANGGDSLADRILQDEVAGVNEGLNQRGCLGQPHNWLLRSRQDAAWRKKCDAEGLHDPIADFGDEADDRRHQPASGKSLAGLVGSLARSIGVIVALAILATASVMLFREMAASNERVEKIKTETVAEATQAAAQTATQVVGEAVAGVNEVLQTVVDENAIAHDTFSQRLDGLQTAGRQLQEQLQGQMQELTDPRSGVVAQAKRAIQSDIAQTVRQEVNGLKEQLAAAQKEAEVTKQKLATSTAESAKAVKSAGEATVKAEEAKTVANRALDYGSTAIEAVSVIVEKPTKPLGHSVSKDTKEEARGMIAELRARYGTPTAAELKAAVDRGVSKQITVKQLPPLPPMKRK